MIAISYEEQIRQYRKLIRAKGACCPSANCSSCVIELLGAHNAYSMHLCEGDDYRNNYSKILNYCTEWLKNNVSEEYLLELLLTEAL